MPDFAPPHLPPSAFAPDSRWSLLYRNWRGEVETRLIQVRSVYYGTSPYHPKAQWLLEVLDCVRGEVRTFALSGILEGHRA